MKFKTNTRNAWSSVGCVSVCVMPSGTERFHHNVTPAATEREVNTQGRGTQGSVCACVCVQGTTAAAPAELQEVNDTGAERERERDLKATQQYSKVNHL